MEVHLLQHHFGYVPHAGQPFARHVIDGQLLGRPLADGEDGAHEILDVNIGFRLGTVAEHIEPGWILLQPPDEIENGAVRATFADHVGEPQDPDTIAKAAGEDREVGFRRKFRGAIERHGLQRSGIFLQQLASIAEDG